MAIDAEPKQRMVMVDDDRAVCSRSKRSYALQYCIYLQVGTTCALGRWRNSAIMLTYSLNAESDSEHRPHGPDRARAGHFIGKFIKCAPVARARGTSHPATRPAAPSFSVTQFSHVPYFRDLRGHWSSMLNKQTNASVSRGINPRQGSQSEAIDALASRVGKTL